MVSPRAIVTRTPRRAFWCRGLTGGATYTFTVAAINRFGTGPPSAASNAVVPTADPGLVPLVPARLLETRPDLSTIDGQYNGIGPRETGTVTEVHVTGRAGIATNAIAAVLNITAIDARAPGFITVYPCGQPRPNASSLNYITGTTIPNAVIAPSAPYGTSAIYTPPHDPRHRRTAYFPGGLTLPLICAYCRCETLPRTSWRRDDAERETG